ncbi:MAG: ABC transporter ATP-binding protein [Halieaceae bacterium]|jgi:putative ABC transport system ATP-binding protein|nr:ABC transporter ATP-binding protein [Halieaceae bacterium]
MIELDAINRHFLVGDQVVRALDEVSLEIGGGEYVSIMGPSGSGKSTLLNLIGLLDRPTAGRYRLNGEDVTSLSDVEQAHVRNREIGFVFQMFHLVPRLTATENVELPLVLAGVPFDERRARVAAALAALGMTDRAHHRPEQLSGGQRQRVAIARATISEPKVLLADEPTGNLDQRSGSDVIAILEGLVDRGLTLIMVTHDAAMGRRAQRQLRMMDGRVVADERRGADHAA